MTMRSIAHLTCALALVAPLWLEPSHASADDTLKIAIGQINNWENQPPTLGSEFGIYKKLGLVIESFGTQGAGETLQPVIAGSADLGARCCPASPEPAISTGT